MKKTNAYSKSTELNAVLSDFFQGTINKARLRLISHFICALCKVQTVTFSKLANGFDSTSKAESSLRRIQRFISGYTLDRDLIAKLVFGLLPKQEKYILSIDRTNWKFGELNIVTIHPVNLFIFNVLKAIFLL